LNSLTDKGKVLDFFNKHFPDVVSVMPNLLSGFFASPTSPLMTVRCAPWHYKDKIVLMGDAAHAIVPFYGQGMNAGFEDALMFDELWTAYGGDPALVLSAFSTARKPSTDALADLSYANFKEMASHTASATFLAVRDMHMCKRK
jgi:kynurenine 3-monooxygenase